MTHAFYSTQVFFNSDEMKHEKYFITMVPLYASRAEEYDVTNSSRQASS